MSEAIEQLRQKAALIATRINSDAQFKAQVLSDPESTLVAAGLPEEAIPAFLAEQGLTEVNGYFFATCQPLTCGANSQCENTW